MRKNYFIAILAICAFSISFAIGNSYAMEAMNTVPKISTDGHKVNFEDGFANLADRLLPTVVNVSTRQKIKDRQMPNMPEFAPNSPFEDMFRDFFDRYGGDRHRAPRKREVSSLGSGFVIDAKNGYIVTNNHVVEHADDVKIILHDDTSIEAEIIGRDKKTDIAVLKVKTNHKLVAAKWGDSSKARVGNWVFAIGNPFGLGGTVTAGIISARQRDINAGPYDDFIQTDASINRGNSGGPMFNIEGEVIGVNTAIFSPTGGSVGIGFAIPSNLAKNVVAQLIKYGKTKRGWLGVKIQKVTDEIAESLGLSEAYGALVSSVVEEGPASKANIKAGDIILEFDGKKVTEMRQLPRIVAETEVGKKVSVILWRDGKRVTTKVKLGELEKAEEDGLIASVDDKSNNSSSNSQSSGIEFKEFGMKLLPLTVALRQKFNIAKDINGLVILDIEEDSSAYNKGLQRGDVIVEAGQEQLNSTKDFRKVIKKAKKAKKKSILLLISRDGDLRFVGLRFKR